jgi:acetyltransferase
MNMDRALTTPPPTLSWPLGLDHSMTIRPIQPEDLDLEADFIRGLSPQSLYNRIFTTRPNLSRESLERLTRIDFSRDMAIIATVTIDGTETQIGVARYVRLPDDRRCEFAIAVADQWQGCGVGKRLLGELIGIAKQAGIDAMIGDVLATNTAMLAMVRKAGMAIEPHPDGATLRRVVLRAAGGRTPTVSALAEGTPE